MEFKKYSISEVIEKMEYGQIAIMVENNYKEPFSGVGTAIYYDESDYGILKFLNSNNPVMVTKGDSENGVCNWIIVDGDGVV